MKRCTVCGVTKPITDFHRNARSRDGHRPDCQICVRAYLRGERRAKTTAERLWEKVVKSEACWEFLGSRNRKGYGLFTAKFGEKRETLAHRASWRLTRGAIPTGSGVLHRCDNPCCVKPEHLFLGTQRDNLADMRAKGRHAKTHRPSHWGESSPGAKLSLSQVIDIRRAQESTYSLAARYGVSQTAISQIRRGMRWRHVPQ